MLLLFFLKLTYLLELLKMIQYTISITIFVAVSLSLNILNWFFTKLLALFSVQIEMQLIFLLFNYS